MSATNQPLYRRPSWARKSASYKHYMRTDLAADRSPGADHGLGSFSYDEAHVSKWQCPPDLAARLPPPIQSQVEEWACAGAAICTALERIKKLDDMAIHRAYPEKSIGHLSRQSPAAASAETPPMSSPISPAPSMPQSVLPLDKLNFESLPHRAIGMESPPFTPIDTQGCPTPNISDQDRGMPDATQLTRQLSPISMISRGSTSFSSDHTTSSSNFDENAWETYLGFYNAELHDIQKIALSRFKGAGYSIDRSRVELGQCQEQQALFEDFSKWWAEMKPQVAEYDKKVGELEAPSSEYVRMERQAQGLPI
ncbi:Hypothetical predicted protein [Lecanosticta acicola]|uniref:Uncharacterized protein n=1 Tax=Lecanosticta acicola TaxID=111012 RepID=A0AAI9E9B0_9PEZI|nr:Hypothetical predicted protein [Lecanosticta acicola]